MHKALIVVDVQNDFCPGGALAVANGGRVASHISAWLRSGKERYELVVATMDWHPPPGGPAPFSHFAEEPDYTDTWPPHCVQGSHGAQLHPDLSLPDDALIVRKGENGAAYSGFEGHDVEGTPLAELLRRAGIDTVDVVGLATDYCVRATAMDARTQGLSVRVLLRMVAGVAPDSARRALDEMQAAGIACLEDTEPQAPVHRSPGPGTGPAGRCAS